MRVLDYLPPAERADLLGIARSLVGQPEEEAFMAEVCRLLIEWQSPGNARAVVQELFDMARPDAWH